MAQPESVSLDDPLASARPARTFWRSAWGRLRRNKLAVFAICWILFMVLVTMTADLWAPRWLGSPTYIDSTQMKGLSKLAPSLSHPFGTDELGRDVLCRVAYGGRISLTVGLVAIAISTSIGLIIGAIAGYYGGILDSLLMRLTDIVIAFPFVLAVIALLTVLGPGVNNMLIALGIMGWPATARVFRSAVLSVKENDYVDAARAMGASDFRIIMRHIFPNSFGAIIVYATTGVGGAILSEAGLSFLGLGAPPPTPSWGVMIQDGYQLLITHPWLTLLPGLAIVFTVLSFILLGDGLRDAFDVKMKDA